MSQPDPAEQRQKFAERLVLAGASTKRFIDVHDGAKGTHDHDQLEPSDPSLSGNYGVYGGPGEDDDVEPNPEKADIDDPASVDVRWLVDVDVDDYEEADSGAVSTEGLDSLPDTFTIESPHTDGDTGGHRYYAVQGHVAAALFERYDGRTNPSPEWGEIRVHNQYCVGPGSQISPGGCDVSWCDNCKGCDKDWCDNCAKPDGGYYRIADDREISTLTLSEFMEAVEKDYNPGEVGSSDSTPQGSGSTIVTQGDLGEYEPDPDADAKAVVRDNEWMQQYLAGLETNPDRSEKDFAMCRTFIEAGVPESDARDLLENSMATKVGASDASANYWSSTWKRARLAHEQEQANGDTEPDETDADGRINWQYVRYEYAESGTKRGRSLAAEALEDRTAWMHVREEDRLWCYDQDSGTFDEWGGEIATGMLESGLGDEFSRRERNEIVARIKARNQVHRRDLDGGEHPDPLVCVGDGVIDLETGELLDHSPEYRFTRGMKWEFDRDDADPEAVLDFLDDITRRPEDRDTILDHLAHGLMPGHPYRAFVITYGEGANGKTQLQDLIEGFVGRENAAGVSLDALAGGDDFATGALPGNFVNIGDDEGTGEIRDTSMLKSLTGGGTRRANAKNEKQFEFKNEAAMFFSANEPPRIAEQKDSIDSRIYPIELPYRFVSLDEYDPENPLHKHKVPQIAKSLTSDEAAMCGLLQLVVEHAQRLIESDGQYSMPEGPAERRALYDAASDPISRFVVKCLEQGEDEDMIAKDDVYAAYTALCRAQDERMTDAESFKRQFAKKSTLDVETARPTNLTPSGGRDNAWTHIRFAEEAKPFLTDRLIDRYFGDGDGEDDEDDDDGDSSESIIDHATPIIDLEHGGNPYRTVTARVEKVEDTPENGPTAAGVLSDSTGKIDYVAWDTSEATEKLTDPDREGQNLLIYDARISTDGDGNDVLDIEQADIQTIGAGVGHIPDADPGENETLGDDGDDSPVPDDAEGIGADAQRVAHLADEKPQDGLTKSDLAGTAADAYDMDPDRAMSAIDRAVKRGLLSAHGDDVEAV